MPEPKHCKQCGYRFPWFSEYKYCSRCLHARRREMQESGYYREYVPLCGTHTDRHGNGNRSCGDAIFEYACRLIEDG